jgi:4-amino-4-deoxy-L-arabinose transferase-like glycosyltransferase
MRVLGENRVAARLPSLFLFALFFAFLARFLRQLGLPTKTRFWWFAFFLFHPLLFKFGISAEMDGSFAALSGIALLLLVSLLGPEKGHPQALAFLRAGFVGGLAVLIKGPMAPILFLGPVFLLLCRKKWGGVLLWLLGLLLPIFLWLFLLIFQGMDGAQLISIWERETVGRNRGFPLLHFLKSIPVFLLSVVAMGLPPLLIFFGGWKRPKVSTDPRMLALGLAFGVGTILLLLLPHRPTRYVLPALLPGLVFLLDFLERGKFVTVGKDPSRILRWSLGVLGAGSALVLFFLAPPWMVVLPWVLLLLPLGACFRDPRGVVLALGICGVLFLGVDRKAWAAVPKRSPVGGLKHLVQVVRKQPLFAWGHVPPLILWELGGSVRQSEFFQSPYRGEPWILWEKGVTGEYPFPEKTKKWEEFRFGRKTLVLSKRTPK